MDARESDRSLNANGIVFYADAACGSAAPQRQPATYESLLRKVRLCAEEGQPRTEDVNCAAQALWAAAHRVTSLPVQQPKFPWVERDRLIDLALDSAVHSQLF
jgi:hypothetical protein